MEGIKKRFSLKTFTYNFRNRGRRVSLDPTRKTFSIIDYKAFSYYIKNNKEENKGKIKNYVEHGKIISALYKIIGEKIVSSEGGVFMEGLGYFGIIQEMKNRPAKTKSGDKLIFNPKTDGIIYNIAYVPIDKTNTFKVWAFDYSFVQTIKTKLSIALKASKKYTFNPSLFFYKLKTSGNDL